MTNTETNEVVEIAPTLLVNETIVVNDKPATNPVSKKKNEAKKTTVKKSVVKKEKTTAKPDSIMEKETEEVETTLDFKPEMIEIFKTTYGYYRYWVKNILADGGIKKFRFVKDVESYNGKIAVAKTEIEKAKKALADYRTKNPDNVKICW